MTSYQISAHATGRILEVAAGETLAEALDTYAREAAYPGGFAELAATLGKTRQEALAELQIVAVA